MEFEERLNSLLTRKRQIDLEIENLFVSNSGISSRFSSKKFVGDLGEYYFSKAADFLSELTQSTTSNFDCDFVGKLLPEFQEEFNLDVEDVRIEVKTRHAQIGNNHLFGIMPEKFDLLAFVALSDDFICRHIGMIKSTDIKVDNQNRIRYSNYYNEGLVLWKTNEWKEL
jgi:hypothetical protein